MSSLYKRPNSPFYWIKYRDPVTGKIIRKSTRKRVGIGTERRDAIRERDQVAAKENKYVTQKDCFSQWVPDYLRIRYRNILTYRKAVSTWTRIEKFLQSQHITHPAAVRREHVMAFFAERTKTVCTNSALIDIFYFQLIMNEAVEREIIARNPCARLGIKKGDSKEKPEVSDEEIATIRKGITELNTPLFPDKKHPTLFRGLRATDLDRLREFYRVSFEISIHQGCRLFETYFDVHENVNLDTREITFHGKGDRYYSAPLHPELVDFFKNIRAKRRMSYEIPIYDQYDRWRTLASLYWIAFLKSIGLSHLSFHCFRVTVVSRLHRAGVPENVVMKLVNHATTLIHRRYRRLRQEELSRAWPSASPGKPFGTETKDFFPTNPLPP